MTKGFSTKAVHAGEPRPQYMDSITTPVVFTSSYTFDTMEDVIGYVTGELDRFEYGRYGNPTTSVAMKKLKELEQGDDAEMFDSGMGAVCCTILGHMQMGDHVVITDDAYKKTLMFCEQTLPRFGIKTTVVEMGDYDQMEDALKSHPTKMIISETPTNPYLNVADMDILRGLKEKYGAMLVVDSTFASPYNQLPLHQGADLVIHSTTKYLGGHNDILGGVVIGPKALVDPVRDYRNTTGGVMDPMSAFLLLRGLKTLSLRMERLNATATKMAQWLETHPKVRKVYYPGLPSHRDHELAKKYMTGFGGVVTFELQTSDFAQITNFLNNTKVFRVGPSFGGVEALITHPMTISYYNYTAEERQRLGILDELIRMSVGVEDFEDLRDDVEQALSYVVV